MALGVPTAPQRANLRLPELSGRPAYTRLAELASHKAEQESFVSRFGAAVASRPARLIAAFLATALTPVLIVNIAGGSLPDHHKEVAQPVSVPAAPTEVQVGASLTPEAKAAAETDRIMASAVDAAAACPGLPAQVLVAIAHVETGFGRDVSQSQAGALGPMQFLPSTWMAYASDGDGDGRADVMNPHDAIHSAAQLLCANGAAEPARLRSALWNYNHSNRYVDEVLRVAGMAA